MNASEFLKTDHRQIEEYFDQIEQAADSAERRRIFTQIRERLMLHMELEEAFFYPEFEDDAELDVLIQDAYDDHIEIKGRLSTIGRTLNDSDFDSAVDDFIDAVEAHVTMEESEILRRLEITSARDLERIGARLLDEVGANTNSNDSVRAA